jgi:hypothetical protein
MRVPRGQRVSAGERLQDYRKEDEENDYYSYAPPCQGIDFWLMFDGTTALIKIVRPIPMKMRLTAPRQPLL